MTITVVLLYFLLSIAAAAVIAKIMMTISKLMIYSATGLWVTYRLYNNNTDLLIDIDMWTNDRQLRLCTVVVVCQPGTNDRILIITWINSWSIIWIISWSNTWVERRILSITQIRMRLIWINDTYKPSFKYKQMFTWVWPKISCFVFSKVTSFSCAIPLPPSVGPSCFECHHSTLFYSRLCPSTVGSSSLQESSIFPCPLLSLSIQLPVAPQCHLSNNVLIFLLNLHPISATLCF